MSSRKSKILFVYPPISDAEKFGTQLRHFNGYAVPLGIFYLAAYLRERDYQVGAIDGEASQLSVSDVVARYVQGDYNVLGLSVSTVAFHKGLELARAVREARPGSTIIIGGPHVASQPEHSLTFDAFDYAVSHEGEVTLAELLERLEQGQDPGDLPGLVHRGEDGEIRVNEPRPYIQDLDSLPLPAFDLIPDFEVYAPPLFHYKERPVGSVITSRGCPYQCTFCEKTTFGNRLRLRGAQSVVDELELLVRRHGVKEISFSDDTFTLNRRRVYEIFDGVRARGLKFSWTCMARMDRTVDESLLRYMKDNGCWYILFGIESGDPEVLREIKKKIDLDDVRRIIDICHRIGIVTKGFFIVGHPKETPESIERTIKLACDLKLDYINVTINTPMPGSYQYEHVEEYGTLDQTDDTWSQYGYWHPVFVPHGLTPELLTTKHKEFYSRFYFRPRAALGFVRNIIGNPKNLYPGLQVVWDLFRYSVGQRLQSRTP